MKEQQRYFCNKIKEEGGGGLERFIDDTVEIGTVTFILAFPLFFPAQINEQRSAYACGHNF